MKRLYYNFLAVLYGYLSDVSSRHNHAIKSLGGFYSTHWISLSEFIHSLVYNRWLEEEKLII